MSSLLAASAEKAASVEKKSKADAKLVKKQDEDAKKKQIASTKEVEEEYDEDEHQAKGGKSEEAEEEDVSMMQRVSVSTIKRGAHVFMDGRPCKITRALHSKTGKHGHMKCHLVGVCVISGSRHEMSKAGHMDVIIPPVQKQDYQLVTVQDDDDEQHHNSHRQHHAQHRSLHLLDPHDRLVVIPVISSTLVEELVTAWRTMNPENDDSSEQGSSVTVTLLAAPVIDTGGRRCVWQRALTAWHASADE